MLPRIVLGSFLCVSVVIAWPYTTTAVANQAISVAFDDYRSDSPIAVTADQAVIRAEWPLGDGDVGRLRLNLAPDRPLIEELRITRVDDPEGALVIANADPVTILTVGSRGGRAEAGWVVFFDKVWTRPFETHRARLALRNASVSSDGNRVTLSLGDWLAGPFFGKLEITLYTNSPLIRIDSVFRTSQDRLAVLYDFGLVSSDSSWQRLIWTDTKGRAQSLAVEAAIEAHNIAARNRIVVAQSNDAACALFPPPHQFFYPLDETHNLHFSWAGNGYRGLTSRFGFGIRQHQEGDRRFVPWFNAPPGADHRMGVFCLLSRGDAARARERALDYTREDRFLRLPGHLNFTSHYHFAHTMQAMRRREEGQDPEFVPEFVDIFKTMGIDIVHLAEFHGDGHPRDAGPRRLEQMHMMHEECRRLSDDQLLVLPGEEPNVHLGGHWIDFFPTPVYWIMSRESNQPFLEQHPKYGKVYRVGNAEEMLQLLEQEAGLAWTAHPRIKSSFGYPDRYRTQPFYLSDRFLGAAWKAMPADLSRPKLGERVLDLLDDMANWGQQKYILGEVDVFKIDATHELYGHMNVNYLRLEQLPAYDGGWHAVLETLRKGKFFVTSGEVLIPHFSAGGIGSGDILTLGEHHATQIEAEVQWTFPLAFAEIVSGDGTRVFRHRINLNETESFGQRRWTWNLDLAGRRWIRLEVWDVAANGAFTQPVWIE